MGHKLDKIIFKTDLWKKYLCPKCRLLLKDAVQPSCGHWLCQSCADAILAPDNENLPVCPRDDCGDELTAEDGVKYFPDRFVRREILSLPIVCSHRDKGCKWEGKFSELEDHQKQCQYGIEKCEHCGLLVGDGELEAHELRCPEAPKQCPCVALGCSETISMKRSELVEHLHTGVVEHLQLIVDQLGELKDTVKVQMHKQGSMSAQQRTEADGGCVPPRFSADDVETDSGKSVKRSPRMLPDCGYEEVEKDGPEEEVQARTHVKSKTDIFRVEVHDPDTIRFGVADQLRIFDDKTQEIREKISREITKIREEIEGRMSEALKKRDEEIASLRTSVTKLERMLKAKNAEIEDRDFRLSLIENCNYDGTMLWKIPQFSQRMADAQNGKYTSIFSLPFYTGRYGYKMCLRLYILGDGIGKNNYVSLFFVVMRGEFDNILPWPFSHKVTFRLINQAGGRDIIDTFQPDPMSSSFKKPKSDMNVASGCPRFVSHHDLKNSGFIIDDTIFIKCVIDRTTIKQP